jgi:ribosomal protein L14E/L6E/L27E
VIHRVEFTTAHIFGPFVAKTRPITRVNNNLVVTIKAVISIKDAISIIAIVDLLANKTTLTHISLLTTFIKVAIIQQMRKTKLLFILQITTPALLEGRKVTTVVAPGQQHSPNKGLIL